MKRTALFAIGLLLCLGIMPILADAPITQSANNINLRFGPILQTSDGNTPITGLLTGSTITATGGSTTTITTATTANVGQYIVFGAATATTALRNIACYITTISGSGPYTLTVAPTLPASPTSSDTYNLSNIGVFISKNGSTWATPNSGLTETGKGWYYVNENSTDTNTVGPIMIHWDVYGSTTGISNETSPGYVVNINPYDAVRGGFTALPNANAAAAGGLPTYGTGAGQINPDGTGAVPVSSGTGTGQISLSAGKVLLQATQTGVTIPTVTTVTNGVSLSSGQNVATVGGLAPPTNWNLASIDSSGRGLLQPSQPGVTIPTVTSVTNSVAGVTGVTFPSTVPALSAITAALPSDTSISTDILGATATSWNTAGTIGSKINAAGTASDPWATALPGSYGAGTAGNILGNNLSTATSSLATAANLATLNSTANTINTNTTGLPSASSITTAVWSAALPGSFTSGQAGNIVAATASNAAADVFATVPDSTGTITFKQEQELALAVLNGTYSSSNSGGTITTTYKKADNATVIAVSVVTGTPAVRSWTFSNL